MTAIEQEIRSTPAILQQTLDRVAARRDDVAPLLQGPVAFLGCGSSYGIALTAAALYEAERGIPAQAIMASEYRPRPGWSHVAISRTGQTSELIGAMRQAGAAGAPVLLIGGEPGSPAEAHAGTILSLDFAPEQGVIQTRFVTAATLALRLLIGGGTAHHALAGLPAQVAQGLAAFDPAPLLRFDHLVFLGRGWRYGLARLAALNLQETALLVPEGHQTLEYRHGPLASASTHTLVWCFDPLDDPVSAAVLDEIRGTGATVRCDDGDPLLALVQLQSLAVRIAEARGIDPDAPRHISRAVVLPSLGS